MKYKILYCLECEKEGAVEEDQTGHTIMIAPATRWDEAKYGWCEGPFTSCPPPDNFSDDWDLNLEVPSDEELAEMNLNAEMLVQELEKKS